MRFPPWLTWLPCVLSKYVRFLSKTFPKWEKLTHGYIEGINEMKCNRLDFFSGFSQNHFELQSSLLLEVLQKHWIKLDWSNPDWIDYNEKVSRSNRIACICITSIDLVQSQLTVKTRTRRSSLLVFPLFVVQFSQYLVFYRKPYTLTPMG